MGSIPPAASIEYPQREIVNIIADAGLIPDNADLHQVARAVQSGNIIHAVDSGPVNTLIVTLTPAISSYQHGLTLWVTVHISNTGAATINVNNVGVKNIVRRGGDILAAGDMPAGYKSLLVYSLEHNNFELYGMNFAVQGAPVTGFMPILLANTTLYVNGTTGSDTLYDGTTAAVSGPHGPYKTIMRAVTETYKYGPSVYTMTIMIAAGTYPEAVHTLGVIGPTIYFTGAGITQTYVTGANNQHTFNCGNANTWVIQNLCCSTGTGTGPPCGFSSSGGATIYTDNCASGYCQYSIWEAYAGYITVGNHTFNANSSCTYVIAAFFGGFLGAAQYKTWTFLGTFSCTCFATVGWNASMEMPVPGQPVMVNPGFVTGQRYSCVVNGTIAIQGLGPYFFPGTSDGGVGYGGQYI